ncbi:MULTISPECIES: efflux RND transporter periplasmic adaptor subunit [Alphaproteobacteria]|uniref:Hemolysin secretion protein D n=2 Tax=Alphaproteobacteria TaxID=28211 RepID=A0A512HL45_9HYPH|nr:MULTISPECIES: efflux RND transporter periplasmic adaptor subunit [Alphaproteobacteria]GEO86167.1 hemolysin secretion protein D [Ciceribacter naphthalenivorans]GLR22734.1 hemolysin secretion protein D [Ciceribacter naphthalenivorans]GLT05590.1 hemolysin secretion protein D [Sphingomonas psychrolutea]
MYKMSLFSLLLAAALAGCSAETAEVPKENIRPVKVVEIAPATTTRELSYSGAVRARSETPAGFRVGGKIVERKADIGDRVAAGDVLARLDATDYELSLASARANLVAAERQVETAAFAMNRADQLFKQQVAAKAQLEQAQLVYNQAVAARDSAKATLAQAENQVAYAELKADRDGIVTAVHADAGQVVAAGTPVVTVAVGGEKEVSIAVPESDVFAFTPGKAVEVGLWSNDKLMLKGTVREVAGSADPASRTFAVRIAVPDDARVLLGMTASVKAVADGDRSLFDLPLSALARGAADRPVVWTVDPAAQTVHERSITVVDFADDGVRVSDGLNAGDLVVVAGTQFMAEGLKVKALGHEARQAALMPDTTAAIAQIR